MEIWFVIILSVLAVLAIALLLYIELMGDSGLRFRKPAHRRGEYINDQTAVICHTVKDTVDSEKAYTIFVEYIFTNYKLFLLYEKNTFGKITKAYFDKDIPALVGIVNAIKEMKVELKDQKASQIDCLQSIDPVCYIESNAWINLASSCLFEVNEGLRNLADVCVEYLNDFTEPFPDMYYEQLGVLVDDIGSMSTSIYELIGTGNIQGMRDLRKEMSVILSESYANSQRLYDLLHDGMIELDTEKRIALQYALNAFQEIHCIIYTMRRLVLSILCISLSVTPTAGLSA
ncbi:MAG: hypothetical protein K2G13_06820 [Muribaculaceae bacterium]|nr:hypothetical protein [Muribaculaceae bacterium]